MPILERLLAEQGEQRQHDRAHAVAGEVAERELGALAQEHADAVAFADALGVERVGQPRACGEQLAERPVAHAAVGILDDQGQRVGGIVPLAHRAADVEALRLGPAELAHRLNIGKTARHHGTALWHVDRTPPPALFCSMSPDDHSYAPVRVGRSHEEGIKIVPSVCPHDCTSTCALDVERLDARRSAGCAARSATTTPRA